MLRYDTEEELIPLKAKDIPDQNYDAIVISDYNKGYLSNRVITEIFERFNDCRIFVATKREDISCFGDCLIKVNEKESSKLKSQN